MIHKRKFLFKAEFHNVTELIGKLQEIEEYAKMSEHGSPSVEIGAAEGSTQFVYVFEETLSDQSTQLVMKFV